MQKPNNRPWARALSTACVLGVTALASAMPALADDDDMASDKVPMTDWEMTWPLPLTYPMAAPGGLNIYHYKDYSMTEFMAGSMQDHIEKMKRKRDEKIWKERQQIESSWTAEDRARYARRNPIDPMNIDYPFATPGGLNMYHYKDYSMTDLEAGSVDDRRMEQARIMDDQRIADSLPPSMMASANSQDMSERRAMFYRRERENENEEMRDPVNMNYPLASPGGLSLYHYTDYSRSKFREGSAAEWREKQRQKRDKKIWEERMKNENK